MGVGAYQFSLQGDIAEWGTINRLAKNPGQLMIRHD